MTSYTPYSQKFYVVCEGRTLLEYTHVFGHVDIRKGALLLLERADGVALRFIVEDVVWPHPGHAGFRCEGDHESLKMPEVGTLTVRQLDSPTTIGPNERKAT